MKKRLKKVMLIALGILLIIIGSCMVFFNISYSKTKNEFEDLAYNLTKDIEKIDEEFTEQDIENLPAPVQRYFRYSGFIGTKKMAYFKAKFNNVDFSLGKNKPTIKIDYTQYNIVETTDRIAYIDSSMFGIPFEGIDKFVQGKGSMKGVVGKLITLFNQKGESMDKASLVTFLSESLIVPSIALQDYITWEEIDDNHVKASISYLGINVSGVFTFNEKGEMITFTTDDREATTMDGKVESVRWTALCSNYVDNNGIMQPTKFQAIWHYDDGDLVYFDSDNINIEYY